MATADTECADDKNHMRTEQSFQQGQGIFEAETCREEADLHIHMTACQKNPGHTGFVPANKFTVDHLPAGYQDDDIAQIIKALADITVRVSVKFTSFERPDCYPGTAKPFPAKELKGTSRMRVGSGKVSRVGISIWQDVTNEATCPCEECKDSSLPRKDWAYIVIITAAHLVYDKNEAAHTTCYFFYDTNDTHLNDVPSIHGANLVETCIDGDICWMYYITHDISLGNKLRSKWELYMSLHKQAGNKYKDLNDDHNLTVIVSHPHGFSKQISVGEFVKKEQFSTAVKSMRTQYTYTTPTCPGSSGAPIYVLSHLGWSHFNNIHGGQCEDNLKHNYSGIGMF